MIHWMSTAVWKIAALRSSGSRRGSSEKDRLSGHHSAFVILTTASALSGFTS